MIDMMCGYVYYYIVVLFFLCVVYMNQSNQYIDLFNITPSIIDNLTGDQVVQTDSDGNLISLAVDLASSRVSGILPTSNSESKVVSLTGSLGRIVITGTQSIPIINIDLSYLGQTSITTLGNIILGDWKASVIGTSYTEAKLKSISAVLNRTVISGTSTDSIIDISSNYVGQNTISILGTLTSAVWNASPIDGAYINYNTTNLKVMSNKLTTIQDISTLSSPTFIHPKVSSIDTATSAVLDIGPSNCNTVNISRTGTPTAINGSLILPSLTGSTFMTLDSSKIVGTTTNVVTTISGTSNQIIASGSTGNITLSTPQNISTTSSPTFNIMTVNTLKSSGNYLSLLPDNSTPFGVNDNIKIGYPTTTMNMRGNYQFNDQLIGSVLTLDASANLTPYKLNNGQVLIGSTGANCSPANITGTNDQIIVTNGANTITLSTPQSINTTSSPTFSNITATNLLKGSSFGIGITPSSNSIMRCSTTNTNTDGSNSYGCFIDNALNPSSATTNVKQLSVYLGCSPSSGTTTNSMGIFVDAGFSSGGTITNSYGIYVQNPAFGTNKYAAYFGGRVGINIVNPTTDLQLNADSASKPSTSSWSVSSDARIKTDIKSLDLDEALNKINAVQIRTFKYIQEYKQQCQLSCVSKIGLVADELELIMPSCVSTHIGDTVFGKTETSDGVVINNLKSINIDELHYMLIAAVQKLSQRNDELMTRIVNLEAKLI